MQNPQMAGMAAMNAQGPVDGMPMMANGQRRPQPNGIPAMDARDQLNTYIYDYFLRNNHHRLAAMMVESEMKMSLNPPQKSSPSGRNVNGVDSMDQDSKDIPTPKIPANHSENSFLLDWWVQFWDIWGAARRNGNAKPSSMQYIQHARTITQAQSDARSNRMMMAGAMGGPNYPAMMRMGPNGVGNPNDLKRAAAMNNHNPNGNAMANMNQMKNGGAMMGAQMQRDGSQMDMNGQRSQSPGSNENGAPSPNKRPRVDGGMNGGNMPGAQMMEFNPNAPNVQQKQLEGMNSGVQGSPMAQAGLDGQHDMFAGNPPRNGMPAGATGPPQGNHALQDYQMQLMLLEQQNKKRLLMARQEQDNMSTPHGQGGPGGFPANMSPQGSRAGPSPNPADQMKKNTPRMGGPGSPMPEGAMQQQRNSPAPAMPGAGFDPNGTNMPPNMHQYGFPGQMPQGPMMARPPSSHPNFNGQQLTPQQMEAMQRSGALPPNGAWRGPQQAGMMPGQQMGPMGNGPQRVGGNMPPPPAPPAGEQPRAAEPSPSQSNQAPPTPNQGNKAAPKKKGTKDGPKKPANKKGANAGTTAASGAEEPPTPSTPVTPMHAKSFNQNGQQQPSQPPAQQPPAAAPQQQQQQQSLDMGGPPFGSIGDDPNFELGLGFGDDNALENFDFDSFLHVGDDSNGLGAFGGDFGGDFGLEAGGDQ